MREEGFNELSEATFYQKYNFKRKHSLLKATIQIHSCSETCSIPSRTSWIAMTTGFTEEEALHMYLYPTFFF